MFLYFDKTLKIVRSSEGANKLKRMLIIAKAKSSDVRGTVLVLID